MILVNNKEFSYYKYKYKVMIDRVKNICNKFNINVVYIEHKILIKILEEINSIYDNKNIMLIYSFDNNNKETNKLLSKIYKNIHANINEHIFYFFYKDNYLYGNIEDINDVMFTKWLTSCIEEKDNTFCFICCDNKDRKTILCKTCAYVYCNDCLLKILKNNYNNKLFCCVCKKEIRYTMVFS